MRKKLLQTIKNMSERQALMLVYALPNLILAVIAVLALGIDLGWATLLELPFNLLLAYLVVTTVIVTILRWHEIGKEGRERDVFISSLKTAMVEAIRETREEDRLIASRRFSHGTRKHKPKL